MSSRPIAPPRPNPVTSPYRTTVEYLQETADERAAAPLDDDDGIASMEATLVDESQVRAMVDAAIITFKGRVASVIRDATKKSRVDGATRALLTAIADEVSRIST